MTDQLLAKEGATFGDDEQPASGNESRDQAASVALERADKAPFATRLRMVILLSIACWLLVAAAIALLL